MYPTFVSLFVLFFFKAYGDHRDLHNKAHSFPTRRSSDLVDCLIVDTGLQPPSGGTLASGDAAESWPDSLPVVLFGNAADPDSNSGWQQLMKNHAVRKARSREELLDQTSFFLHRSRSAMSEAHQKILRELDDADGVLRGKKATIVDDDIRNIFALTSLLEDRGMIVSSHDSGRDAVHAIESGQEADVILMDIMMPEQDGFDTIREIRKIPACNRLPIIA